MNNLVIQTIEKYVMLKNGDRVIAALSGGADSVTLLDVLYSLREKYNLTIFASHLNHLLRGDEAERDQQFCEDICKGYDIKLYTKRVDIKQLSKKLKISEELCGRNERYAFFEELSNKLSAKIATAHTASDNCETLIYNITRGSSVKGVAAIPPVRDNIIRPLIECTREQIEAYCTEHKLKYVTDSTNLTDEYTRNLIRHTIVPQLKEINPKAEQAFSRLSNSARELIEMLNRQTEKADDYCKNAYGYDCGKLLELDSAVLKNLITNICREQAGFTPESRHLSLIIDIIKYGGDVEINKNITFVSKQGTLRLCSPYSKIVFEPIGLKPDINFNYNSKNYSVKLIRADVNNMNSISEDYINNAVFRTRREGDRFTYPKRKITKPLRKVFNEQKLPSELRDNLVVLAKGSTILWCEVIGTSLQGKDNSENEILIEVN